MISSYILMSYNKKGIEGTFKSYFSVLEKHHVEGQGDGTITSCAWSFTACCIFPATVCHLMISRTSGSWAQTLQDILSMV